MTAFNLPTNIHESLKPVQPIKKSFYEDYPVPIMSLDAQFSILNYFPKHPKISGDFNLDIKGEEFYFLEDGEKGHHIEVIEWLFGHDILGAEKKAGPRPPQRGYIDHEARLKWDHKFKHHLQWNKARIDKKIDNILRRDDLAVYKIETLFRNGVTYIFDKIRANRRLGVGMYRDEKHQYSIEGYENNLPKWNSDMMGQVDILGGKVEMDIALRIYEPEHSPSIENEEQPMPA